MKELWRVFNLLFIPKFKLHCGHVGAAGTLTLKHEQAFRDLLVVDTIRGPDSTGIAGISRLKGINVVKKALLPNDLFTLQATRELFQTYNHVLMGHNRWATQGAVNGVNAHPFEFENMVGAHNGTLVNQSLLPDSTEFEVDSENLLHSIQKIGVKETYKRLHGAAALVWYETDGWNLNFLRNKERPMFITYANERKTIFWASEAWMLEGVLWKNGIEHTDIFNTDVDTHYRFHIPQYDDEVKKGEIKMVFGKVVSKKLKAYAPPLRPKYQKDNIIKGTFTGNNGATHSQNTDGGVSEQDYKIGEEVCFYLDKKTPTDKRYILCHDSMDFNKRVMVYCKKDSWLRHNLKAGCTEMYAGTVNGFFSSDTEGMGTCVQENSITQVAEEDIEYLNPQDVNGETQDWYEDEIPFSKEEFSLEDREHQVRVIKSSGSICGICSDDIKPHPRNYCLSENTIICDACRDTEFAQELIKSY